MQINIAEENGEPLELEQFIDNLELLIDAQKDVDFADGKECLTKIQLKTIVRQHAKRYQDQTKQLVFDSGFYMHFFGKINAKDENAEHETTKFCENLFRLNEILKTADFTKEQKSIEKIADDIYNLWIELGGNNKNIKQILWRLFSAIMNGRIEVAKIEQGSKSYYYIYFDNPEKYSAKKTDQSRIQIFKILYTKLGMTEIKKPDLENLLNQDDRLTDENRNRLTKNAEKVAFDLRSDLEIIALSENEMIDDYFKAIHGFFEFFINKTDDPGKKEVFSYFLKEYLSYLKTYYEKVRCSASLLPFASDMLLEAYLIKTKMLDGVQEPNLFKLFDPWEKLTNGEYSLIKTVSYPKISQLTKQRADATLCGIPVYKQDVCAEAKDSLRDWINEPDNELAASPGLTDQPPQSIVIADSLIAECMKDEFKRIQRMQEKRKSAVKNSASLWLTAIDENTNPQDVDALAQTVRVKTQKTVSNVQSFNHKDLFTTLTGETLESAEKLKKEYILSDLSSIKSLLQKDKKIDIPNEIINQIRSRYLVSDNLKKFFIYECMFTLFEVRVIDEQTKEYFYSLLASVCSEIAAMPDKKSYSAVDTMVPENDPVLLKINCYSERIIKQISETGIKHIRKTLNEEQESMLNDIREMKKRVFKKMPGGFFKKTFGNKELKKEIDQYFAELTKYIDKITEFWDLI